MRLPKWWPFCPGGDDLTFSMINMFEENSSSTYRENVLFESWCELHLTHPLDKIAVISQTNFFNAFSWMKSYVFDSNFAEVCSQGAN